MDTIGPVSPRSSSLPVPASGVEAAAVPSIVDRVGTSLGRGVLKVTRQLQRGQPFVTGRDGFLAYDSKTGDVCGGQAPGAAVRAARDLPSRFAQVAEILGSGLAGVPVQFSVGTQTMSGTSDLDGNLTLAAGGLQPTLSTLDPKRGGLVRIGLEAGESGTAQANLMALPRDYDGPIFVSDIDKTLRWTSELNLVEGIVQPPIYGIPQLFAGVAALRIPIVYLSAGPSRIHPMNEDFLKQLPPGVLLDRPHPSWRDLSPSNHVQAERQGAFKQGVLEELRRTFPNAKIFGIGDDQYGDAMAYHAVGATAYIHNVQPNQANIPDGFGDTISDCYTPQFQARVLGDLKAAVAQSVSCGGNPGTPVPVPDAEPSPPPIPDLSIRQRLQQKLSLLRGVPTEFWHHLRACVSLSRVALHHCQGISDAELAKMSAADLGALADSLLHGLGRESTKIACGEQFMRIVTSHGRDAGHTTAILSHLQPQTRPEQILVGAPMVNYMALRQGQRPKAGDWAGLESFLDTVTHAPSRSGTTVQPMLDGAAFPVVLAAIDGAQTSVSLCVPAVKSDQAGWQAARHLADAAGRGCAVRLVYDPVASSTSNFASTDRAVFDYLSAHGVEVVAQPPGPLSDEHRTHRSVIVIDGTTAFTGSMSLGDEDRDLSHRLQCRVLGPAVADLQRLFADRFKASGTLSAAAEAALFPAITPVPGGVPVRVIGHRGQGDQAMKVALLRAIDTAAQAINLEDPKLSDGDVINHLAMAAQRGVNVRVVLPEGPAASVSNFRALLNAGASVFAYKGYPMSDMRVATFDGQVAVMGSSKPTPSSLWNNDEADLWCANPALAQILDQTVFSPDVTQSHPVQLVHVQP